MVKEFVLIILKVKSSESFTRKHIFQNFLIGNLKLSKDRHTNSKRRTGHSERRGFSSSCPTSIFTTTWRCLSTILALRATELSTSTSGPLRLAWCPRLPTSCRSVSSNIWPLSTSVRSISFSSGTVSTTDGTISSYRGSHGRAIFCTCSGFSSGTLPSVRSSSRIPNTYCLGPESPRCWCSTVLLSTWVLSCYSSSKPTFVVLGNTHPWSPRSGCSTWSTESSRLWSSADLRLDCKSDP